MSIISESWRKPRDWEKNKNGKMKKKKKTDKDGERMKLFIPCITPVAEDPSGYEILIS